MASWASHNKGSGTALWITFVACILDFCLTSQAESIAGQTFVQHPKSEQSDAQNLHEFVDSPSLQKTSIFEIFDVENKVEDYRQILLACYAEIRAGSGEVAQQIYEDDVVFFEGGGVDNQMAVPSADPSEVAAKELHRRIRELHLSGEAYALLTDENEQSRRSTALWEQFSRDAVASLLQHNPRNLLQPSVSKWIHQGMFASWPYAFGMELAALRASPQWEGVWEGLIEESPVGRPPLCALSDGADLGPAAPQTSSNLVHQVFHLAVFGAVAGWNAWESNLIVEFGGGYARLCLSLLTAGFAGQYVIFDLPVFAAVQEYYLASNGVHALSLEANSDRFRRGHPAVYISRNMTNLVTLLNDPSCRRAERNGTRRGRLGCVQDRISLFIAMWSLAEAPMEARAGLDDVIPLFDATLMGYRDEWGGVDNEAYVEALHRRAVAAKYPSPRPAPPPPPSPRPDAGARAAGVAASRVLELPPAYSAHDRYWVSSHRLPF